MQRRHIKLQIDTKILGLVEVLQKCETHDKKVNYETTPIFEGPVHDMQPLTLKNAKLGQKICILLIINKVKTKFSVRQIIKVI